MEPRFECFRKTKGAHQFNSKGVCKICGVKKAAETTTKPPVSTDTSTPSTSPTRFFPWHPDLDKGKFPREWDKYGSYPHIYSGRRAKPKEFRGFVKLGSDYASIGGSRYSLRGMIERVYGVITVNNAPGAVMIEARDDGVLRWWVYGDSPPTGPEVSSTPNPVPSESETRPVVWTPPAKYGPKYSTDGCVSQAWIGGFVWNPVASKGPKLIVATKFNRRVAWVTAWGSGFAASPKIWRDPEGETRTRYYFPLSILNAGRVTFRLHIPDDVDRVLVVENPKVRQG